MPEAIPSDPTDVAYPRYSMLLEMRSITKRFPGVLALNEVNFDVRKGEVHALVGENGAGKSTLMKILSGVYERDSGEVVFKGQPVAFRNPRQSQLAGITTIYQRIPARSAAPLPWFGLWRSTVAPAASATRAVSSFDPSSTTSTGSSAFAPSTTGVMRCASL